MNYDAPGYAGDERSPLLFCRGCRSKTTCDTTSAYDTGIAGASYECERCQWSTSLGNIWCATNVWWFRIFSAASLWWVHSTADATFWWSAASLWWIHSTADATLRWSTTSVWWVHSTADASLWWVRSTTDASLWRLRSTTDANVWWWWCSGRPSAGRNEFIV